MQIRIDGEKILVKDASKSIVEIADENGITIVAPCFRNGKIGGCCKVCVIEADGTQRYACGTKPEDGMDIIYNRPDLSTLRKTRLAEYAQVIKSGNTSNGCCGSDSENGSSCACSCSSCCD